MGKGGFEKLRLRSVTRMSRRTGRNAPKAMKIDELIKYGIPQEYILKFKQEKIIRLYPPQVQAIKQGLFDGENLVISCPTASGKTLIASFSIVKTLYSSRKKVVYLVPLIALAQEKYNYYRSLLDTKRVALSCGDLDSSDPWLARNDLIIATVEKFDSLIRHGLSWMDDIGLIIADEIHLINDANRGPTLEVVLTQLKRLLGNCQMLALSATINNACDLAGWLQARPLISEFRPVKLYEGVAQDHRIWFADKDAQELNKNLDVETSIVEDTIRKFKKQILFFVSTRRASESLAERLSKFLRKSLSDIDRRSLEELARDVLSVLDSPTRQCKRLCSCIKGGVGFHHAGLLAKQKQLIEKAFRNGLIKVVVATPTLAMGVNLPAFRVVIRDIKRYYSGKGSCYIPVLEYKQFVGRAGRPQYDKFGESIVIAKSGQEREELQERYIWGSPENIESKLASQSALRMHVLSLVASDLAGSFHELLDFFSQTFFGYQYQQVYLLEEKIRVALDELAQWNFILCQKERLKASSLGKRISQLYIDPLSAHLFVRCLQETGQRQVSDFSILHLMALSGEITPFLLVREKELPRLQEVISGRQTQFLVKPPKFWDQEYDDFLSSMKLALIFEAWINEKTEEEVLEEFGIAPGELQAKLQIVNWLIYCLQEISKIKGMRAIIKNLRRLQVRLRYGVKEELLDLVALKEIGRVRARRLFQAGIKNPGDIKRVSINMLSSILGPKIAVGIKAQLS
jgi:helicase